MVQVDPGFCTIRRIVGIGLGPSWGSHWTKLRDSSLNAQLLLVDRYRRWVASVTHFLPELHLTIFFGTPALLRPTEVISPRYGPMVTLLPQSLCDVPNRLALLTAFSQQKVPALNVCFC